MISSFAGITLGTGFLAVAHDALLRARLQGAAKSAAREDAGA
jgi:hypothetical protein